ncbi:hypothetical protein [Roseobacter sp. N2S]|uniref:hypothetical protein n=1 Tax=Roseobacter sp. N2S TaxID=2663844 RepID=UPI00286597C5|nr:hypothetical protein [Roseobacter sp. N2S]MDR6264099.1 hypothetical protein [Roseobacter sp. N2S]
MTFSTKFLWVLGLFVTLLLGFVWLAFTFSGSSVSSTTYIYASETISAEELEKKKNAHSSRFTKFCKDTITPSDCKFWDIVSISMREGGMRFTIRSQPRFSVFGGYSLANKHVAAEEAVFSVLNGNIKSVRRRLLWLQ